MDIKNHNTKRENPVTRKWLRIAVFIAVFVGIVLMVFRYFGFVSKTIYEESVSHLTEVFHQSDNMLRELTDKNLTYLHMWGENLQNISSEDEIRDYMEDKLDKQYYDEIENVIAFSVRMNLNYDCLRSIAFELNNGLKFQEAINDLNIIRISQYKNIKIIVEFENQATLSGKIKEWQLYDNTITDMSIYLPDNIRPLSYVGEYIGEFPMNFSNNYIDKDKRMLMFHVTNPEPEYDIAYTHESQDEEKTDEGKKITDILDKLYIGQKIKRIYAVPSDQKDKFRFF